MACWAATRRSRCSEAGFSSGRPCSTSWPRRAEASPADRSSATRWAASSCWSGSRRFTSSRSARNRRPAAPGSYPVLMRTVPAGIVSHIGHTPLLRVRMFEREFPGLGVRAKAEWFNPGGSVKDRPALSMIEDGERRGALTKDRVIIDSTSGNTGIAYALVGAAKGYRVKLVMPGNVSAERKALVTAFGAEIVYSDAGEGSDAEIRMVRELVAHDPDMYFYPDQYSNPANPRAHYEGTAVEILEQTGGRITHFIAGLGTTGTFVGVARRLKEHDPSIHTIAVEPDDAFHGLEGLKHLPTAIVPP